MPSVHHLSTALWGLRESFDVLEYRLVVQQMVLAGGHRRFVGRASDDVAAAFDVLNERSLGLTSVYDAAAGEVGLVARPDGVSLRDMISTCEETGDLATAETLRAHLSALGDLRERVEALQAQNRDLVARGLDDLNAETRLLSGASDGSAEGRRRFEFTV